MLSLLQDIKPGCYYNGEREAENEHGERESEKWEQNLTWTLALSVTIFPILCSLFIFSNSVPRAPAFPAPRFSNIRRTLNRSQNDKTSNIS